MQFRHWFLHKRFLTIGCLICLLLIVVDATVKLGVNSRQSQLQVSQVRNKTTALQVVSIALANSARDNVEGAIALTVKNVLSDKKITGLAVANGDVEVQIDFTALDYTITPGAMYSYVARPQSPGSSVKASDISVLAAILDDRTYNGDAKVGQRFLDRRTGEKRELELLIPVLKNALTLREVGIMTRVLSEIEKLPDPHHSNLPGSIRTGSCAMRDRVLGKIQSYQESGTKTKDEDRHFLYRSTISRIRAHTVKTLEPKIPALNYRRGC